jgi:hypothetical protein
MESYYKRQQVYQNTAYKRLSNEAEDELGFKIKKMPTLDFKKSFYNIFNPETPVSDWVNEQAEHMTVESMFDYYPKSYGFWLDRYFFDPDFDWVKMWTIPAVWAATLILIIGGPW